MSRDVLIPLVLDDPFHTLAHSNSGGNYRMGVQAKVKELLRLCWKKRFVGTLTVYHDHLHLAAYHMAQSRKGHSVKACGACVQRVHVALPKLAICK
jgi:hypothetical protein